MTLQSTDTYAGHVGSNLLRVVHREIWGEGETLVIRHTHQLGEKEKHWSSDIHANLGRSRNIGHQTYTPTWGEAGTLFIRYTHQLGERQKYRSINKYTHQHGERKKYWSSDIHISLERFRSVGHQIYTPT